MWCSGELPGSWWLVRSDVGMGVSPRFPPPSRVFRKGSRGERRAMAARAKRRAFYLEAEGFDRRGEAGDGMLLERG